MSEARKPYRQVWIGDGPNGTPTDMAGFLRDIVGWQVGCENAERYWAAVNEAKRWGWIGERVHHYPNPDWEPTPAYCLTEAGFEQLAKIGGDVAGARAAHAWYADWPSRQDARRE